MNKVKDQKAPIQVHFYEELKGRVRVRQSTNLTWTVKTLIRGY